MSTKYLLLLKNPGLNFLKSRKDNRELYKNPEK